MHLKFGVGKYTKLYTIPKTEAHLFFTPKGLHMLTAKGFICKCVDGRKRRKRCGLFGVSADSPLVAQKLVAKYEFLQAPSNLKNWLAGSGRNCRTGERGAGWRE